jgi:hypothetical protein
MEVHKGADSVLTVHLLFSSQQGVSPRVVAKLDHEADPPDSNGYHAHSDAKCGCRRDRTGNNPADASDDDAERNEIAEDRVAHVDTPRYKEEAPVEGAGAFQ